MLEENQKLVCRKLEQEAEKKKEWGKTVLFWGVIIHICWTMDRGRGKAYNRSRLVRGSSAMTGKVGQEASSLLLKKPTKGGSVYHLVFQSTQTINARYDSACSNGAALAPSTYRLVKLAQLESNRLTPSAKPSIFTSKLLKNLASIALSECKSV